MPKLGGECLPLTFRFCVVHDRRRNARRQFLQQINSVGNSGADNSTRLSSCAQKCNLGSKELCIFSDFRMAALTRKWPDRFQRIEVKPTPADRIVGIGVLLVKNSGQARSQRGQPSKLL
jgi:hypothetical protein